MCTHTPLKKMSANAIFFYLDGTFKYTHARPNTLALSNGGTPNQTTAAGICSNFFM